MRLHLTISQKLWIGLGVTLTLLAIVAAQALLGYKRLEGSLVEVVHEVQPLAMEALDLRYELEQGAGSLSRYLLTKEAGYRDAYLAVLEQVGNRLDALQTNPQVQADRAARELVAELQRDFADYRGYRERMLPLATDLNLNFPGVAVASNELNPIGEELRTLAAQMVGAAETDGVPLRLLQQLNELRYLWANVMVQIRGYLGYRDAASAGNLDLYLQQAPQLIQAIAAQDGLPLEIEGAIQRFAELFAAFQEPLGRMREVHESARWRTDAFLLGSEVAPLHARLDRQLNRLVELLRSRITVTSEESLGLASTGATVIAVLGGLALALGLLAAWSIARVFRSRVCSAVNAMVEVAEGDGNLARRLDDSGRDEMSQLAGAFNKFVAKIKGVVDLVTQCSTGLSAEAGAMSRITAQTRDGAERQQREISEVAQAVAEMSSMVGEIAEHAGNAADSARAAAARSASGRAVVDDVTSEIEGLASQVSSTADVIRELEQDSETIGEVVAVIREIAEQTNLLALNAAIEAARAGEQGRGFAVVADEVRNLANRTQRGTQDIRERIEGLQQRTHDAVAAMESGNARAHHSVEQARQARDALDAINEAVNRITRMNERIAEATTRQTALSEHISAKTQVIREIADATVADARQTSSGSNELNLLAAQMEGLVTEFLLKEAGSGRPTATGGDVRADAGKQPEGVYGDVELF